MNHESPPWFWWAMFIFGLFYGIWIALHPKEFIETGKRYRPKWLGDFGWQEYEIRFVGWVFAVLCAVALMAALWSTSMTNK